MAAQLQPADPPEFWGLTRHNPPPRAAKPEEFLHRIDTIRRTCNFDNARIATFAYGCLRGQPQQWFEAHHQSGRTGWADLLTDYDNCFLPRFKELYMAEGAKKTDGSIMPWGDMTQRRNETAEEFCIRVHRYILQSRLAIPAYAPPSLHIPEEHLNAIRTPTNGPQLDALLAAVASTCSQAIATANNRGRDDYSEWIGISILLHGLRDVKDRRFVNKRARDGATSLLEIADRLFARVREDNALSRHHRNGNVHEIARADDASSSPSDTEDDTDGAEVDAARARRKTKSKRNARNKRKKKADQSHKPPPKSTTARKPPSTTTATNHQPSRPRLTCFFCKRTGHIAWRCPDRMMEVDAAATEDVPGQATAPLAQQDDAWRAQMEEYMMAMSDSLSQLMSPPGNE